jgi:hypothetical protein
MYGGGFAQKVLLGKEISRQGAKRYRVSHGFLCAFARDHF